MISIVMFITTDLVIYCFYLLFRSIARYVAVYKKIINLKQKCIKVRNKFLNAEKNNTQSILCCPLIYEWHLNFICKGSEFVQKSDMINFFDIYSQNFKFYSKKDNRKYSFSVPTMSQ